MYLHLGNEEIVRVDEVVGIFDIDNTSTSKTTRRYLAGAEKEGIVVNVTQELPKSFVVTAPKKDGRKKRGKVYISQISSQTLKRRSGMTVIK